ncbi:MAG TPA: glycosyltransferase family 2 protein [Cellvibrio sp.]|nr:glycosyltransferase family 2 protein [Cellvibrio sp.]
MKQLLSIIVPMYNEAEGIDNFFSVMEKVLAGIDMDHEIICIDDGSKDATLTLLRQKHIENPNIKVIALSRNFGKEAAMTAAIDYCSGDAVIPIDSDLQDPPEIIGEMIDQWRAGFDVVYAKRISRDGDTAMKRNTAGWFYKLFNRVSDVKIPENVGDYRLMDKKVIVAIRQLPEKDRFMKGLFCWPGFKSTTVEFVRQNRAQGTTKFNYWKLWNFALSGITSFSTIPIRMGVYLGLTVSAISFLYGAFTLIKAIVGGPDVPGYASLMTVMLFVGGIQLFFMGLMGEYIGRIYKEVKNRPIYYVAEELGFMKK